MKNICFLTGTRAEFSLLKNLIVRFQDDEDFKVDLAVTGTHLSHQFGNTYKEIEEENIKIDEKIEILMSSDSANSVSKTMGIAMISFADYFERKKPDALVVLGDRYEALAIVNVAMIYKIPVIHLYGGEATEGLIDEAIRHSITKMSYLHFTSTDKYRKRVIQLGESPDRVFNVGSLGVENIKNIKVLSQSELEKELGIKIKSNMALFTYHPVTLEDNKEESIDTILEALDQFPNIQFIFTKSNSDTNGQLINYRIEDYVKQNSNCTLFDSLGQVKYFSLLKHAKFVIGNSSSGIIEVPSFNIPTVNIGDRQKGRVQSNSIINCDADYNQIINSINGAINFDGKILKNANNPYEGDNPKEDMYEILKDFLINNKIKIKKKFYDIEIGDLQ